MFGASLEFNFPLHCEVCGRLCRTPLSFSGHLRYQKEEPHLELKVRWRAFRDQYRSVRYCRKCGEIWVTTDKKKAHSKRCPRCQELREKLGKKKYEALGTVRKKDPRQPIRRRKSQWDGTPSRNFIWTRGDPTYLEVIELVREKGIVEACSRLSLRHRTVRAICEDAWGPEGFSQVTKRHSELGYQKAGESRKKAWEAMVPDEKALFLNRWHANPSGLELRFGETIKKLWPDLKLMVGCWKSVEVGGSKEPREADLKLHLHEGLAIVIFCDGEAFHGPTRVFPGVEEKMEDDLQTARAFQKLGYHSVRYSSSEIHSGQALEHLRCLVAKVQADPEIQKTCRVWFEGPGEADAQRKYLESLTEEDRRRMREPAKEAVWAKLRKLRSPKQ